MVDEQNNEDPNALNPAQRLEMARLFRDSEKAIAPWRMGIITIVTVFSLFGIYWILRTSPVADVAYARGLITVLISVCVVSMAIILVLSMLLHKRDINDEDGAENEKKFQRSKEILSLLIGILGTIVGFYFGTTTTGRSDAMSIVEVVTTDDTLVLGAEVDLTVFIAGGTAPFAYEISFKSDKGLPIQGLEPIESETNERWIREKFTVTREQIQPNIKSLKATIDIADENKVTRTITRTFLLPMQGEGDSGQLDREEKIKRAVVSTMDQSKGSDPASSQLDLDDKELDFD